MSERHLTFVQFGDYREAYRRLAAGGPENYVAQRYSVDHVTELAKRMEVSVVCLPAPVHDERLENGVRSLGLGYPQSGGLKDVLSTLERLDPTDVIAATPNLPTLLWCLGRRRRLLPILADSFTAKNLRQEAKGRVLGALLARSASAIVANHNVPASLDLARIGVPARKIVPWDWPAQHSPRDRPAKQAPPVTRTWTIMYVGMIAETKGVGDAIRAMAYLRGQGLLARLSIGGSGGEIERMKELVASLELHDFVTFLGRVPNREVVAQMQAHDLVLVPSRHDYPEGLPMTIYEGLSSRSPLIVSDHPMFARVLKQGESAVMFEAAHPASLAQAIAEIMRQPELYARLSERALETWESIQCPVKWGDLVDRWLRNSPEDCAYFAEQSLAGRGLA